MDGWSLFVNSLEISLKNQANVRTSYLFLDLFFIH